MQPNNLGPGADLFATVKQYDFQDNAGNAAGENEAIVVVFGTGLGF